MPQSEHIQSRSSKRKLLVAEDGVVYESIVINNDIAGDAESLQKQAEAAEQASK